MTNKILLIAAVTLAAGVLTPAQVKSTALRAGFRDAVTDQLPGGVNSEQGSRVPKAANAGSAAVTNLAHLIDSYLYYKSEIGGAATDLHKAELGRPQYAEEALQDLRRALEIMRELNAEAGRALAQTPRNQYTLAAAKLLLREDDENGVYAELMNIKEKYPEMIYQTRPHRDLMVKITDERQAFNNRLWEFLKIK